MRYLLTLFGLLGLLIFGMFAAAQDDDPTPSGRDAVIQTATALASTEDTPPPSPQPDRATDRESRTRSTQASQDMRNIVPGEPTRDEIGDARLFVDFALVAMPDTAYTISLSSDDFDTYLLILDANGQIIAENDDGGTGTNSQVSPFRPAAAGTYTIRATSFRAQVDDNATDSGMFTLNVSEVEYSVIDYGETINGNLDEGVAVYTFTGNAGDTVIIQVQSEAFDSTLALMDGDNELSYNDDSGDGTNSLIGPYELQQDGLYTIQVESFYGGDPTGEFTLYVNRVDEQPLTAGEPVTISPEPGQVQVLSIENQDNQLVSITVEGADVSLLLLDIYDFYIGETTSAAPAPQFDNLVLNEPGLYNLLLFPGEATTSITVTLTLKDIPQLSEGENTLAVNEIGPMLATFEVTANETVQIIMTPTNEADWDVSVDVLLNDRFTGYYSGSGGDSLSFTYTFNESGTVTLRLSEYRDAPSYTLTLQRLAPNEK
jgi:hypothetical protein